MTQKIKLAFVEFYLTNICNLNCQGCNSISNFNVAGGVQIWNDHADVYAKWAERLDISVISLIGGEPTLNPDYKNWIPGIRKLWPNAEIMISTNGVTIDQNQKELYDLCCTYDVALAVTIHNPHSVKDTFTRVKNWLTAPLSVDRLEGLLIVTPDGKLSPDPAAHDRVQRILSECQEHYKIIKDPSWPDCNTLEDWYALSNSIRQECLQRHNFNFAVLLPELETKETKITDANNVVAYLLEQFYLVQGIVKADMVTNQFKFNQSDPVKAFAVCSQSKCPQFYQGKLHKCAPSHVFKDIVDQFDTDLSSNDLELIRGYSPVGINSTDQEIDEFIQGLKYEIPQCKFCPDQEKLARTFSSSKKTIQIKRLSK
jgi:hypothetical protein